MDDTPQTHRKSRDRLADMFVTPNDPARRDQPPFQVRDLQKIYAITTIDPGRVQPFLPPGLKVAASATGVMSINVNGGGTWGQYPSALHGVAVEGLESPDGMEAVYWLGGCSRDGGFEMFRRFFLHSVREGDCSIAHDGRTVTGYSAFSDGTGRLSIHMTRLEDADAQVPPSATQDSSYHYLGDGPDGRARIFSMYAYGKKVIPARLDAIEMAAELPAPLRALTPLALKWGVYFESMSLVYSPPRTIDAPNAQLRSDHARGSLLSVIDRHPSPAVVVDAANRLCFVNRAAEALPRARVRPGQTFWAGLPMNSAPLSRALASVRDGQVISAPFALHPDPAAPPLLGRVLAADPGLAGPGGAILVLSDLFAPGTGDPAGLLRLLGLTPAEARLGAAVGEGLSIREAGERLGVTEATARSVLKSVYGKLGISRQSGLARICARLELA